MELAFLLAILYGCIDVVSRMVNYQATRYLGTANGSFLNYFFGSLVCLAVLLVTGGGRQALAGALVAPWWSYLGAVCGLLHLPDLSRFTIFGCSQMITPDFRPVQYLHIAVVCLAWVVVYGLLTNLSLKRRDQA